MDNPELYEAKHIEPQLEECKKMQKCGMLHQREELQYIIDDHLLRPEMKVRWTLRKAQSMSREDASDFAGAGDGYAMVDTNGKFQFKYGLNVSTASIGMNLLAVYLDDLENLKNRVRNSLVSMVKEKQTLSRDEYVYDMMTRNVMEYFGGSE